MKSYRLKTPVVTAVQVPEIFDTRKSSLSRWQDKLGAWLIREDNSEKRAKRIQLMPPGEIIIWIGRREADQNRDPRYPVYHFDGGVINGSRGRYEFLANSYLITHETGIVSVLDEVGFANAYMPA